MAPVNTTLYDTLGVEATATSDELKQAYRRRALRLHPDKGGDPDEFKKMKEAYDVLSDPQKRQLYDEWGPEAVAMREGKPVSPEAVARMLSRVSTKARLYAVIIIICIALTILSPAILVALKWDTKVHWPWIVIFAPMWLAQVLIMLFIICVLDVPPLDEDTEPDEEDRARHAELRKQMRVTKCIGCTFITFLVLFEIFIGMRLEHTVTCSWFVVFLPVILLEFFFVKRATGASKAYEEAQAQERTGGPPTYGFKIFLWQQIGWHLLRLTTFVMLAAKSDGIIKGSWYICMSPLLFGGVLEIFITSYKQSVYTARRGDLENQQQEDDMDEHQESVCGTCCFVGCWGFMVCMAAGKLDGSGYSAFYVFLPIFLIIGVIACFFACFSMCFSEEHIQAGLRAQREHEERRNLNAAGNSGYGTAAGQNAFAGGATGGSTAGPAAAGASPGSTAVPAPNS